ncbi:MAG TPA: glycine--tRNA ligase subunit beta, partial [Actinobacteria bacterium]|nr:glycine--tRNA ligase subunit beta [Actinomycetota bacterium]
TFKKQMYWGDYGTRFIRPIRWLLAILGSEIIDFKIENVRSGNITFGHRTLSTAPIEIGSAKQYFTKLEQGKTIVDPASRKKMIYGQIKSIEKDIWNNEYRAVVDEKLLKEVIDLVEVPSILIGHFPEAFLYIPADILLEAIKYHQKYFPVVDSSGNITTNFLIVQNGIKDNGDIKKGNERVLRARLSDASFFYKQDKKHDFLYWQEKLKGVIFYYGLGNMNEKQKRLGEISIYLAEKINRSDNKKLLKDLKDASAMCKCDLVTNMVVEFPELQGIVGREYSIERGYDESVSNAISEHYLPESAEGRLPGTETGRIISLADKIDTIAGMFLMGKVPSGSQDPFALRRKASGIVRSILDGKYDIDLKDLIKFCTSLYKKSYETKESDDNKMIEKIFGFITARLKFLMAASNKKMDVFGAVLGSGCSSLKDIDLRQEAIEDYMLKGDIKSIVWPMSRSQNIITGKQAGPVDPGLFKEK